MPDSSVVKYQLILTFQIQGVVEKADVVGAIFGQTEGLFGPEMNLNELQKTWKVGRIEITLKTGGDQTEGEVIIPLSTDVSTAALIAAAVESVEKVGPCSAHFRLARIEDVRAIKRKAISERAKQIAKDWAAKATSEGEETIKDVTEAVRRARIVSYGKENLPAGPGVFTSDWVVLVEGRADVISVLRAGFENVVALEGTKVPDSIIRMLKEKKVVAFLDGDRAGDLIFKELEQVGGVSQIVRAPQGKEVEDLTPVEIQDILKETAPRRALSPQPELSRTSSLGDLESKIPEIFNEINGTLEGMILDESLNVISKVPVSELVRNLESQKSGRYVLFDGIITQRLVDSAAKNDVKALLAHRTAELTNIPPNMIITTFRELGLS